MNFIFNCAIWTKPTTLFLFLYIVPFTCNYSKFIRKEPKSEFWNLLILWHFLFPRVALIHYSRVVGSLPQCIRKKLVRQIQKNLKNIIWYSSYESSKTGKYNTFLVSFIKPLSWPKWFLSCFIMWCKIFSKIIHQTVLREAWPNMAWLFSEVGFRKFVLASELFVAWPYFVRHLTAKDAQRPCGSLFHFFFKEGSQIK